MAQKTIFSSLFALVAAVALAGPTPVAFSAIDDEPMTAPDGTVSPPPAPPSAPPSGKRPPRSGAKPGSGGVLAGPEVPPEAGEGNGAFGGADGKKGRGPGAGGGPMMEVRLFMGALASIDTQLTDEQRTKIEAVRSDIEAKMKAWKEANGEALRVLEEKMRGTRGKDRPGGQGKDGNPAGGPPQGPPPQGPPPQGGPPQGGGKPDKATVEQFEKLRETMPKMDAARDEIMAILTPAQQETLKSNMVGMRKAMEKRGDREGRKGGKDGKDGKGGPNGNSAPEKAPPPADPPKGDYKFPQ